MTGRSNAIIESGGGLDLSTLEIYIGDYLDTSSYTVTNGVVDKYTRELVS